MRAARRVRSRNNNKNMEKEKVANEAGLMEKIVSLAKRRGFVFPGSEIYGGLANSYEYGPVGVELKKNIQDEWWRVFVRAIRVLGCI